MAFNKKIIPIESVHNFCRKWKVEEFSLFGSVLREDFSGESDIDILVSFQKSAQWSLFDIVEMQSELESLFKRRVDIVEKEALRNPFRKHEILNHREVLFAA